jgi:hypothetical protein
MILIHLLGKIYSYYILFAKKNIFKTKEGKEFLQMYAESEVKLWFFKTHAKFKGLRLINKYVDTKKKSDTVFILGSGESINDLKKQDWDYIKEHNIIGLNYSFVHPVIPDYHFMEMIPLKEMQEFFCKITREKYKDVDMFFQYKHILKSGFDLTKYEHDKRMYVHVPHLYPTIYNDILELYFLDLKKTKRIKFSHLVHHNSHIGCAVMFAQILGYKKIVMLGIDLNGGDYFTNSKILSEVFPQNQDYKKINELREEHNRHTKDFKNDKHPTVNKNLLNDRGCVSMDAYFRIYNKIILKDNNVKLFVNTEKSILSKDLDVFVFKNDHSK